MSRSVGRLHFALRVDAVGHDVECRKRQTLELEEMTDISLQHDPLSREEVIGIPVLRSLPQFEEKGLIAHPQLLEPKKCQIVRPADTLQAVFQQHEVIFDLVARIQ